MSLKQKINQDFKEGLNPEAEISSKRKKSGIYWGILALLVSAFLAGSIYLIKIIKEEDWSWVFSEINFKLGALAENPSKRSLLKKAFPERLPEREDQFINIPFVADGEIGGMVWADGYWMIEVSRNRSGVGGHHDIAEYYGTSIYKYSESGVENFTDKIIKECALGENTNSTASGLGIQIADMVWNGKNFLLLTNFGELCSYDGVKFDLISDKITNGNRAVLDLYWNGDYWLIGGWSSVYWYLFKYDDGKITDLAEQMFLDEDGFGAPISIGWNGDFWALTVILNQKQKIYKYNGSRFDLLKEMAWESGHYMPQIGVVGKRFLIIPSKGEDIFILTEKGELIGFKEEFKEKNVESFVFESCFEERYCLFSTENRSGGKEIYLFDGRRFASLQNFLAGKSLPIWPISTKYYISSSHWLFSDFPDLLGKIKTYRYDGFSFKDITVNMPLAITREWNGDYWLLAAGHELFKYIPGALKVKVVEGSLITSPDTEDIYVIEGGLKKKIPNFDIFREKGYRWEDVLTIEHSELLSYPEAGLVK